MITYERLLSYGNIIPLNVRCDPNRIKQEISKFPFEQYNKFKPGNPRYGLSVTSIDGTINGDDLYSLYEINNVKNTNYDEMSFKTPTDVYYASEEVRKLIEPFKNDIGRTHFLKMHKGGYFPPHRDDRGSIEQSTFRIVVPIEGCTPPDLYFMLNDSPLFLNHGHAYFINTNLTHSVFCYTESLMLVMNVRAGLSGYRSVMDNILNR